MGDATGTRNQSASEWREGVLGSVLVNRGKDFARPEVRPNSENWS